MPQPTVVRDHVWHRSLTTRVALSHLVATLTALVILGSSLLLLVARSEQNDMVDGLTSAASVYAAYSAGLATDAQSMATQARAIVARFPAPTGVEVRLFAANGSPLTPDSPLGPFPSASVRSFLTDTLVLPPVGERADRQYVARPIVVDGQPIGVVEVSQSLSRVSRLLYRLLLTLLGSAALALGFATVLALLLARTFIRPILRLGRVADQIAGGELNARFKPTGADEIGRLGERINSMATELQQRIEQVETLAAARQQFYRSVSHELRTPLTAIRGMAENLEDEATPDQMSALSVIQSETARLQRLVEELLQPGDQVLAPMRQRRRFDLSELVTECVRLLSPRAERGGIRLHSRPCDGLMVTGDRDRVKQAILNILDNALKWTPGGGAIEIDVVRTGQEARLMIRDTGPGIPDQIRTVIWERGVHGRDGGQGLGLALVDEVVRAHGGNVRILDEPGTAIEVTLPLSQS